MTDHDLAVLLERALRDLHAACNGHMWTCRCGDNRLSDETYAAGLVLVKTYSEDWDKVMGEQPEPPDAHAAVMEAMRVAHEDVMARYPKIMEALHKSELEDDVARINREALERHEQSHAEPQIKWWERKR